MAGPQHLGRGVGGVQPKRDRIRCRRARAMSRRSATSCTSPAPRARSSATDASATANRTVWNSDSVFLNCLRTVTCSTTCASAASSPPSSRQLPRTRWRAMSSGATRACDSPSVAGVRNGPSFAGRGVTELEPVRRAVEIAADPIARQGRRGRRAGPRGRPAPAGVRRCEAGPRRSATAARPRPTTRHSCDAARNCSASSRTSRSKAPRSTSAGRAASRSDRSASARKREVRPAERGRAGGGPTRRTP